jgi:Domain of unknown function (DUF4260)
VTISTRLLYAALALLLAVAAVAAVLAEGAGWWQLAAFGLGPDLALLLGAGRGLAKGQLNPRAVPVYNAVHRFGGPVALGAVAALGLLPAGYLAGALAWAFHVALDRAVGYGLRTRDGFQRA